jgi:hypothetical protein
MKNNCIFAASITSKSGKIRLMLAAGFFCACSLQSIYGFVPPCGVVNAPTALGVIDSGKGGAVFYSAITNKFLRDMSITEKNCLKGTATSKSSTSAHDTRKTLYIKFLIEKDCKNTAYGFILSHGLFHQFADYCRNVQVDDPHAACISILQTQIQEG